MEEPRLSATGLPQLYAAWVDDLLDGTIPEETEATCGSCAMLVPPGTPPTDPRVFFSPRTKCCTYVPWIPNYLVGQVLEDDDPAGSQGRASVEERVRAGGPVTPLGLDRSSAYNAKYHTIQHRTQGEPAFGRLRGLRCPHYVDVEGGLCGIWRHRNAVCSTYFCKFERGLVGADFWRALQELLSTVEVNLARWCALDLGVDPAVIRRLFLQPDAANTINLLEMEAGQEDEPMQARRSIWGQWMGREADFYGRCARLVAPLSWREVTSICGAEIEIPSRLVLRAYEALVSTALPPRLRLQTIHVARMDLDGSVVVSNGDANQLMRISRRVFSVLPYFDGTVVEEILSRIVMAENVRLSPSLLRRLVDFGVLGGEADEAGDAQ